MAEEDWVKNRRIDKFTEGYLEKIFYFCLKRTGSRQEAEDLASDVALNIVAALSRGAVPASLSAWIWQIARNRYSVWADRKRRLRESTIDADLTDCEISDRNPSAEDMLIQDEELALLRRELAFISSDYRSIIVAYYMEDRKVRDIALSTGLSQGTVKSKLFRARKKLKEGMDMAREFGPKSFKPEEVSFASSGSQPSGLPWRVLQRKLPKNILLEASGNPSTIEELSVELGTAAPYMEEEVDILVKATLLKKVDNKYVTDFFIFDQESQRAIYKAQRRSSQERSEMIGTIASDSLELLRSLGIVRNDMSDNDLLWWAVIALADHCIKQSKEYQQEWPVERANGETWGIVGYEKAELPENCTMSHNGVGDEKNMFWLYRVNDYHLWNRDDKMGSAEAVFLGDVIRNGRNISSFSDSEREQWKKRIENRFAHADGSGNIIPDILVTYQEDLAKIEAFWEGHPLYEKLEENFEDVFREVIEILKKNANPLLKDQLAYCASMQMFDCRMMTVHDQVNSGRLVLPEDPYHSRIAMWLVLRP